MVMRRDGGADLPTLIGSIYTLLLGSRAVAELEVVKQEPALSVWLSVKPDYILCLEDGKKFKMRKRRRGVTRRC
jgi:predicted transcriptional regulator